MPLPALRARDLDPSGTRGGIRFYTEHQLGEKQAMTPEGFLVCYDVPISRTGQLTYVQGELQDSNGDDVVEAGRDGVILIDRAAEEVFKPESVASFAGKPVTNDHPSEDVKPSNWSRLAKGVVQNPRQGQGELSNFVVADLLITDPQAIEDVRNGKREVSCGYDAEYDQVAPGRGVQRNIIGNHVALVERGRCGPSCSIGDHMSKPTLTEKFLAALQGLNKEPVHVRDAEGGIHLHLGGQDEEPDKDDEKQKAMDKRFGDLETSVKSMADAFAEFVKKSQDAGEETAGDPETQDEASEEEKAKATDTLKHVVARAEILSPGFQVVADPKKKKFHDAVCGCQRQALKSAYQTADGKTAIETFTGSHPDLDKLPEAQIQAVFIGSAELLRAKRNQDAATPVRVKDFGKPPSSVADLNQQNAKFWARG